MRIERALVVLLLAFASACGGTSVEATYVARRPAEMAPRPRRSVRIYTSGAPARAHRDVAFLEATQTHGLNEQGTRVMISRIRDRAAAMGCDGVVIGGMRERDGAPYGSGWQLVDPGSTTMHATCIVFDEDDEE